MNKIIKKVLFVFIIFGTVFNIFGAEDKLEIYSPNYFSEQNNIYDDIHYLQNEHLSFKFCTDEKVENLNFNLVCPSETKTISINDYMTTKGCYFSNYNLENISCTDFSLEIDYEIDKKEKHIKRTFKEQKQSMLINHILGEDYTLLNPVDLSYYLIVLTNLESKDSKKSEEIYETLKNIRNNENKCWTSSSCKLVDTSLVLRNLIMAGYNLNTRLLEDGKTYLERKIINNEKNPTKFLIEIDHDFNTSEEIECELKIDDEKEKTYIFDNETLNLSKKSSNTILFTCNNTLDEVTLSIYNLQEKISKTVDYENITEINYDLDKFACLAESNSCDFTNNINSLITYSSNIEDSSLIESYLDSYLETSDDQSYIDSGNSVYEDTGKYLYYKSNPEIVNYLKFKQNNDGSWGDNSRYDKITQTAWSVLGIQKIESSSEYVTDGKKWIYYNEPTTGWGSIEKNTLAYLAIKEQIKPYLKINIENSIKENENFIIENPTIYELKDVKVEFSENIKKYLSYNENLGNLEGENYLTFNVTVDDIFFGKLTGEMTITGIDGKNSKLTLIKIPINIEGPMPFSINEKSYMVSDDFKNIEIEIINNIETFTANCSYINPFNGKSQNSELTQLSNHLIIENEELKTGEFEVTLTCKVQDTSFNFPLKLNVQKSEKNFEITENEAKIIDETDFKVTLTSTSTEKQTISIEITGDYENLIEPTEKEKIIAANDVREIYFTITNPVLLQALSNTSKGEILIKSENGYVKKIPIEVNITQVQEEEKAIWPYIVIGVILILFIIILILRYLRSKENEEQESNNSEEDMYV